jgi:hypothetical protein
MTGPRLSHSRRVLIKLGGVNSSKGFIRSRLQTFHLQTIAVLKMSYQAVGQDFSHFTLVQIKT